MNSVSNNKERKVFIDVGAHYGETLDVALNPKWGFERVLCLEPASSCIELLEKFKDPRLALFRIGLSNIDTVGNLYGAGELGASLHEDKNFLEPGKVPKQESITIVRASNWFQQNIRSTDKVFLKLNCEGSECDILIDLLQAKLCPQILSVYVDFDVRKIPRLSHQQREVENELRKNNIDYFTPDNTYGGGSQSVEYWLGKRVNVVRTSLFSRLNFALMSYAPTYVRFTRLLSVCLPKSLYWWLGRRFGRLARS